MPSRPPALGKDVLMPLPLSKLCADYDARIVVFRAVDEPISNMTVADICTRAGITRKRFYTLFESKEDVFRWFLDLCFTGSLYEIGRSLTWEEGVKACLAYIEGERDVFAASYRSRTDPASRYWVMQRRRIDEMTRTLEDRGVTISPELELEMELYSSMVPALIRRWVERSDQLDHAEFAACWLDCVPNALRDALA